MRPLKTTKDRIVSVARIVFANLSFYKTTMEDIASASKIGRRTIYSYFKSKEELYLAVVSSEIDTILIKLNAVAKSEHDPIRKLEKIFYARMKAVEELSMRNESLKKDFLHNNERIEGLRDRLDAKEMEFIAFILQEGLDANVFDIDNIIDLSFILQCSLKALEVPFINDGFGSWSGKTLGLLTQTIIKGIRN